MPQTIFDNVNDGNGICILDSALNILSVNSSMKYRYSHRTPFIGEKYFSISSQKQPLCLLPHHKDP
ncbi:MAG TPA: hypothetical protein GXZ32_06140 [Clostridiales bacterium]|nr:hypothetical protein [Clostridiales bacterium]